jgi:hypothetical protein
VERIERAGTVVIGHQKPTGKSERRRLRKLRETAEESRQPPDFIIIGAQKGGTTSLYRYLTEHPDVAGASKKEVHFFDRQYKRGMSWYLSHFPERGAAAVVGEASPNYLFHPEVPARIRRDVPNAKLIALLRNPVDRAYSQYQMRLRRVGTKTFEEDIDQEFERLQTLDCVPGPEKGHHTYVARGVYVDQIQRWLAEFPREQLLVLKSEAFFARPEEGIAQTLAFLGLPAWSPDHYEVHNPGSYADMAPETRQRLAAYFSPHNQRLYELLGWDLGWDDA